MLGRSIPTETKVQTVLSWLRKEESARALSRRYQVFEPMLYKIVGTGISLSKKEQSQSFDSNISETGFTTSLVSK